MTNYLTVLIPASIILVGYVITIERRLAEIQRDIVWIKKQLLKNEPD